MAEVRADDADAGYAPPLAQLDLADLPGDEIVEPQDAGVDRVVPLRWVAPVLATLAALLWVAGGLWLAWNAIPVMPAVALVEFLAALCVVPALIGIVWLLLLRTSRAEARRFGRAGEAMRAEAAMLEATVARLSNALDRNRLALATQARDFAALGDATAERFATVGRVLDGEIAAAEAHAVTLSHAAERTGGDLAALAAALPQAQADALELGRLLDRAGFSAAEHANALDAQVAALGERGREAEAIAGGAAAKLAAHIERMDATGDAVGQRLEVVLGDMSSAVDALMTRTADAVDQSRHGIAAQGEAMLAMVGAHQAALDAAARESADALAERIRLIERVIDRIAQRLDAQQSAGSALIEGLDHGLGAAGAKLDALHALGVERTQTLAASISALGGSADAMTEALKTGDAMATHAIGTAETLLIALDSAAREIDETLPDALDRLDRRVAASQRVVLAARPELLALVTAAESTHDAIEAIAQVIAQQRTTVDQLSGTLLDALDTGRTRADAIAKVVDDTLDRTHRFAEDAAPRLVEALLRVRETATAAADKARETLAAVIPEAAQALEGATAEAVLRATAGAVEDRVAAIAAAADAAVDASGRAAQRLDVHLQAIGETTALVESRLEAARSEREEIEREGFARRVSLLIDALNSASIDIVKTFAPDVSDSAWAAYLKGDRGVFTRRAVRLLDGNDARGIATLYDGDAAFRDQVNRYIHDFESMLRAILVQRDGSHLGVTLLSSDMGKLYVALAQAIERLR